MSVESSATNGVHGQVPARDATTGADVPPGGGGPRRKRRTRAEPEFRSYYDLPVINKPVWASPDIPGYFFLGGLAGAGAAVGLAAQMTGRPALAKVSKVGSAVAGQLSLVGLVHDLGRRGRFLNMLRVFKVTSPMSVGSWLLAGFVPASGVSALAALVSPAAKPAGAAAGGESAALGAIQAVGKLASVVATALGLPVATYTAALMSNTAVPAWHDGHEYYPFIFVSSAATSAAGLGLVFAPVSETGPLVALGALAGMAEVALSKLHEESIGIVKEAFHEGEAERYMKAAEILTAGGAVLTATSGKSRLRRAVGGAMLLTGSAFLRFGIFEAGISSTQDPKYTVVPQRERLEKRKVGQG